MTPALRRRIAATSTAAIAAGLLSASVLTPSGPAGAAAGDPYTNASLPVAQRVSDLMSRMTLDEKLGQMTQVDHKALSNPSDLATYRIGSVLAGGDSDPSDNGVSAWTELYENVQRATLNTPLAIPTIFGVDAVHGHSNVTGATIFPHNIGLGATRDADLAERVGRATAEEVAATGINWTFAPCLCVARNDRWGRTYESFGEKPELVTAMSTIVTGLQTDSLSNHGAVLATAKHYLGDGGTTNGVDQGNTQLSESELRSIHLPPFKAAVDKGVGSVMISYSSWNGQKLHGHKYLITDVLKTELGFKGFVVSDWAGIDQIDGARGISSTDVVRSVNAGIDMVMVPNEYRTFLSLLKQAVQNGQIPQSRVDDAVSRILTKKFELGLFENPWPDRTFAPVVGSAEHRAIAREAVRKSLVLLKNQDGVLPLAKTGGKIFVAGKNADDIGNQSGGWTITWQGKSGATTTGTTVLQGIRNAVGSSRTVTYSRDGSGFDSSYGAAIAVIGETPYAEGEGDRTSSMGLDSTDLATLSRLQGKGVPVIVVLVSGRPLDIAQQLPDWNALVAAWLPGTEGAGVADVLFGDHAPSGKLPVTWMRSVSQQPINDGDGQSPLFPYGYGLTYASPTTTTTTCQPAQPSLSSVTQTSITWTIPSSPCVIIGHVVSVYASAADAQAGTNAVANVGVDYGIPSITVNGLKPGTDYWWKFNTSSSIGGPTRTSSATTTTTTTPTTTTTTTTTSTTSTCQPAQPSVSAVTAASITWTIPGNPCTNVSIGNTVSVYGSYADAEARTNAVTTAFADFGITTITASGLKPNTDYWWRFNNTMPVGGPTRTDVAGTTTTTTTRRTTTTTTSVCAGTGAYGLSGRTSNALTWSIPGSSCYPQAGFGVRLYDSPERTNLVGSVSGQRGQSSLTICGLQPDTDYWADFDFNSSGGPYRTLPSGSPGCPTTSTSTSSTTTTTTTTTSQASACTATYKVISQWPGGFQGEVTVKAATGISSWAVGWTFGAGQTVTTAWNASVTAGGSSVTAKSLSWNGPQGAGASTSFGFIGTWSGSNPIPVVTCTSP